MVYYSNMKAVSRKKETKAASHNAAKRNRKVFSELHGVDKRTAMMQLFSSRSGLSRYFLYTR